ncbi:MAG: class I SAM-dependent methyltransferase [Candidatus Contendobacter sp.]|nr:class I SAM-dependent methyltransferase [Candidatus Contendobacter sp.]MDG4558520.1 class I SAM-dependent methyltransferase [Candidatus Contendobacter sp.]
MDSYQGYEDWKRWDKTSFGTWFETDAVYFSAELGRSGIKLHKGIRLYEVGFGNGAFAGYVRSFGCEYFGSEVNNVLVERARDFDLNVYEKGIKETLEKNLLGTFDAVIAFDVLEHLDITDIKAFLLEAMELLKPGGIVLARVPSGDSPFGRAIFHGDITHRTALGSSAVRQLAAQTGFDVIDIGPPKLPIFRLGWKRAIRRGVIRLAQSVITGLINLVFHDGQPRVITANLVFVLKKPVQ